jgi:hypothetical protein
MLILEFVALMIGVYFFSGYVLLENSDDIMNKFYTFFFVFLFQFCMMALESVLAKESFNMANIIDVCVKYGLLSVIAYDTYGDLRRKHVVFFNNLTIYQKTLVLSLMIVAFVTVVRVVQMLITQ